MKITADYRDKQVFANVCDLRSDMTTEEYLNSDRGRKRIMIIAKAMNRSHGISMKQCMEFARKDVAEWYQTFTFGLYETWTLKNRKKG